MITMIPLLVNPLVDETWVGSNKSVVSRGSSTMI